MATVLDMHLAGFNQQVAADEDHQNAHYASPTNSGTVEGNAKTIFFALVGMVIVIYLLHVAGRVVG